MLASLLLIFETSLDWMSPLKDSRGRALSSVSEIFHVQKCLCVALYLKYSLTEDNVALLPTRTVVFREILFACLIKESFISALSPVTY